MDNTSKVAQRYAGALHQAALEQNKVAEISQQMTTLKDVFAKQKLSSNDALAVFAEKIKSQLNPLLKNTLNVLLENNRIGVLPELPMAWANIVEQVVPVVVTTANALNDVEKQDITKLVDQKIKSGDTVNKSAVIRFKEDATLISGVAIQIGDTLIDNSWRHKLNALKLSLQDAA